MSLAQYVLQQIDNAEKYLADGNEKAAEYAISNIGTRNQARILFELFTAIRVEAEARKLLTAIASCGDPEGNRSSIHHFLSEITIELTGQMKRSHLPADWQECFRAIENQFEHSCIGDDVSHVFFLLIGRDELQAIRQPVLFFQLLEGLLVNCFSVGPSFVVASGLLGQNIQWSALQEPGSFATNMEGETLPWLY